MNPSISADRPANMTRRLSVLQQCLLCAAVMTAFTGNLAAEETGEPLARCDVQTIQVSNTAMRSAAIVPPGVAPNNGPSANYRRGRSGDWEMVHDVDGDDPRVRLLVATPDGPLIIEFSVYVDGRAFRQAREEWIDEALAAGSNSDQSGGATSAADQGAASAPRTDKAGSNEAGDSAEPAGVSVAEYRQSGAQQRLSQYVSRSRIPVERDEARWLLAEWVPGPTLLQLRHDFADDRATLAPLWVALDDNGDRRLSSVELQDVATRLRARDSNEDDWVDLSELTPGRSPVVRDWTPSSLGTVLWSATDWSQLRRQLVELYGANSGRANSPLLSRILEHLGVDDVASLKTGDLGRLTDLAADVVARVDFSTGGGDAGTGVAVWSLNGSLQSRPEALSSTEQVLMLRTAACTIELSAGQPDGLTTSSWNGQIAIGTVSDGFPLMRLIDAERDQRLSLREIESLPAILASLDADGDGEIGPSEAPVPIRFAVTLGPHAHELLKSPSGAPIITRPTNVPVPEWFASMDENKDHDLTPAEFLGTQEQFRALDQDGNGRISPREAVEAASLGP